MNKKNVHLEEWECKGFKNKTKTLVIFLLKSLQANGFNTEMYAGDIVHNKYPYLDLEIIAIEPINLQQVTEEMAVNFGIAELYPKSEFGGDGFYLPDQILEASALDCFKHYWDSRPENADFKFETNPIVVIFELKRIKGHH